MKYYVIVVNGEVVLLSLIVSLELIIELFLLLCMS